MRDNVERDLMRIHFFGDRFASNDLVDLSFEFFDRFRAGSAEFIVTQPRMPCFKLGIRFNRPDMVKRFLKSRRTGFYLAVTREGELGAGDSFEDLKRLSCSLRLEGVCTFTGRIPDADVERILATADVCVSPDPKNPLNDVSTMNKVLEYMACAKPVVCFDLREHRHSAGEGALYAEPNRDEDLAAKIEQLLDDPALRERLGAYNRRRFLDTLAWEHNAGTLIEAYEGLCGKPRA